jgi:hypothetical protein
MISNPIDSHGFGQVKEIQSPHSENCDIRFEACFVKELRHVIEYFQEINMADQQE